MGLSASQARLIELTARMSDVEYEGQQINQQRLTLANQMSEIYSQMENMDVPTPPSPLDHMDTVYKGTDGNGKSVDIQPNGDGTFSVGIPKTASTLLPTANNQTVGTVYDYNEATPPTPNNTITATYTPEVAKPCYKKDGKQISVGDYNELVKDRDDKKGKVGDEPNLQDPKYTKQKTENIDGEDVTTDYQDQEEWQADHNAWNDRRAKYMNADRIVRDCAEDFYYVAEGSKEVTVENGNGEVPENYAHAHGMNAQGQGKAITYEYENSFGEPKETGAEDLKKASTGYSAEQRANLLNAEPPYYTDENGTVLNENDFDRETGKLSDGVKLYAREEKESLGGAEALSYEEAKEKYAQDPATSSAWSDVQTRLQNYIKGFNNGQLTASDCDKIKISYDGQQFRVFEDTGKTDKGNKVYNELEFGTGTVNDWKKGTPEFSQAGNLSKIILPDKSEVKASKETELNQISFGAATAKYETKKAQYDQEQKRLNNETSKIQLADKKLDLKLKRLDTERNALNTEIDAVKKVIQDATDHGFKTFSG